MKKGHLSILMISACLLVTSPLGAQSVDLFEARVHGFNQGNRNLDIHVFNADGSDAGYYHQLQCSIVYWANGDTTFPFTLTYDPATQQVSWVVDTPDSGTLTTTSPTTPPADAVNNLHLFIKATAGPSVSTCNAVPYQNCQAGQWACNLKVPVDSSAVHLTNLVLDTVPLPDLSVSASTADPTPFAEADIEVNPGQAWTLTGNVRFTWLSSNGYPPKETRIMFSAKGQHVPCLDEDEDGYSPEGGDCGPVDCDDSDPAVNPGATEVCNEIDDNCDDVVDDVDADEDGYLAEACGGEDCDDDNLNVNPGVIEGPYDDPTCLDGIDNNCNTYIDEIDIGCHEPVWNLGESAEASVYGAPSREGSGASNMLFAFLLPVGAVILLRRVLRSK